MLSDGTSSDQSGATMVPPRWCCHGSPADLRPWPCHNATVGVPSSGWSLSWCCRGTSVGFAAH
eukprot:6017569-Alexandrium_andersonii.AAC.1